VRVRCQEKGGVEDRDWARVRVRCQEKGGVEDRVRLCPALSGSRSVSGAGVESGSGSGYGSGYRYGYGSRFGAEAEVEAKVKDKGIRSSAAGILGGVLRSLWLRDRRPQGTFGIVQGTFSDVQGTFGNFIRRSHPTSRSATQAIRSGAR
jgi:hypothetical protein